MPRLSRPDGICYNSLINGTKRGGDRMSTDKQLLELLEQDPEAGLAALMARYGGAVRAAAARRPPAAPCSSPPFV